MWDRRSHINLNWRTFVRTDQQSATTQQVNQRHTFCHDKDKSLNVHICTYETIFLLCLNVKYNLRKKVNKDTQR